VEEHLIEPHGGTLVDLVVEEDRARDLRKQSRDLVGWDLTPRQQCDLELLASGGFSPLRGFMLEREYAGVCRDMRLPNGSLWPIPVTLDVDEPTARALDPGSALALRDSEGVLLGVLEVEDVWRPDRVAEAEQVFGSSDRSHPGVAHLLEDVNDWCVGGRLEVVAPPLHYDFRGLRHTPAQLRKAFAEHGWRRVVAFQTRNPLHRAHLELTLRAALEADANLLVHPVVGMTKPGDVDHYTRVRCYQAVLPSYPAGLAMLSLLPLAMRMAGPREALWHALIRRNHGVTHFVVGRDHAGPGSDAAGRPFYGPYEAQDLVRRYEDEIGVRIVPFRQMVYLADEDRYAPEDEVSAGTRTLQISGTEQRRLLNRGMDLPEWFTPQPVATELRRSYPPRSTQGVTIFFTGLSGSGKSTIANALLVKLLEIGGRQVSLLDGDLVRRHLSSELGFSREHRDLNVQRIGFVAAEITKNGGYAICAPIAPYDATRKRVRSLVESGGGFVLVHVATSLEVCEQRDRKGLYARARAGLVKEFTGISDPYEPPDDADLVLDTALLTVEEAVHEVLGHLEREGYLSAERV
jgi:sulfate adenylyltransferase